MQESERRITELTQSHAATVRGLEERHAAEMTATNATASARHADALAALQAAHNATAAADARRMELVETELKSAHADLARSKQRIEELIAASKVKFTGLIQNSQVDPAV
jgi:hypothetical protein